MRAFPWVLWVAAALWLVAAAVGAFGFQELYGETSGLQVFLLALLVAVVPTGIGWWAYRRSQRP